MSAKNTFSFCGDLDAQISFMRSTINSCNAVIEHYQFVIDDISSEISDPRLEATKRPVITFLTEMISQWKSFRDNVQQELDRLI